MGRVVENNENRRFKRKRVVVVVLWGKLYEKKQKSWFGTNKLSLKWPVGGLDEW